MPRNPNCARCELAQSCQTVCVWGKGPSTAEIMLVGEAPGANEDSFGEPFVGDAGDLLDDCLRKAHLSRKKVYITNIVKCRPPGNRDPSPSEMAACLKYLIEEIERVKPKVIVCIGRWSLKALTGENAIGRARGRLLDPLPKLRLGNVKIIAATHPAAYLHQGRNPAVLDSIVEDLGYAKNLTRPVKEDATRYLLDKRDAGNPDMVRAALMTLTRAKQVACDLEWLAIKDRKVTWPWTRGTKALSISLTGRIDGKLVTVAMSLTGLTPEGKRLLGSFLKPRGLIFHNAMADVIWLLHLGFVFHIAGDSLLLAYLLDEQRRAGLKGLAPLVAGVEAGWESPLWYSEPKSHLGWMELLEYNAGDTESTLRLDEAQTIQVFKLPEERVYNITRVYKRLLLPAVIPFARAALNGVPMNMRRLRAAIKEHRKLRDKALDDLAEITGLRRDMAEQLAGSATQITRYAREAYGLQIESSRADDLSDYVATYPALAAIQAFKHERKMLSTYLEPWERLLTSQGDNRLHSVYLLGATRTGRLSAEVEEGGSLLLTPRATWIRDIIAVDDPDSWETDEWEITAADYNQLELRLIAWLAPERTMRRLFAEGTDLHRMTAAYNKVGGDIRDFWRKRKLYTSMVTPDERQAGKSNNFGFVFLMGLERYIAYAKNNYGVVLSPERAEQQQRGFFQLYRDLKRWHQREMTQFEERGYTLTPFGRYRFGLTDATQAVNTPIQTTGADLTILAMTVIDEIIQQGLQEDAFVIGFVHDAILVVNRKSVHDEIHAIIRNAMENPALDRVEIDPIPVPLVADIASGPSWAKAK